MINYLLLEAICTFKTVKRSNEIFIDLFNHFHNRIGQILFQSNWFWAASNVLMFLNLVQKKTKKTMCTVINELQLSP